MDLEKKHLMSSKEHPFLQESEKPLASLSVAKWLKIPLLIDEEECFDFFNYLQETIGAFHFYQIQGVTKKEEGISSPFDFLKKYKEYLDFLKNGNSPPKTLFQKEFCSAISTSSESLYSLVVGENRRLIKPLSPVIQMQANLVRFSPEDRSFRCQVYGEDCFSWGIQLAYPQLYQDPQTHEISSVDLFPNTALFKAMQKWVRRFTQATPFVVEGKKQNEPIRIGKKCFSWINHHKELKLLNISVYEC